MGMSASQGRFLMLTGQKSNNEYMAQQISFERLQLANNSDSWTQEYNDAMQNKTLLFGQVNAQKVNYNARLRYEDIVNGYSDGGMSMTLLSSTSNKIVVPNLPDKIPEGLTEDDYFVCPDVKDSAFLEKNIREGNFVFINKSINHLGNVDRANETKLLYDSVEIGAYISEEDDKTDDAEAQRLYDHRMDTYHQADKRLECELQKLETEHKALETEIESVQKVIKDNVEGSFKTFG